MVNFIDSFLYMTAIAYLVSAIVPSLLPVKFEKNFNQILQRLGYVFMGTIILFSFQYRLIEVVLAMAYVILALLSYSGVQDWGSAGHNLLMTVWDLLLAVSFISKL